MADVFVTDVIYLSDQLCRLRPLTPAESVIVERAVKREREMQARPVALFLGWRPEHDAELTRLIRASHAAREIGQALGRSKTAVYKRARVLGLVWPCGRVE